MHEMLTILTDVRGVCLSVCMSVCVSVCRAAQIGRGACSVRRVSSAQGHSVQPSLNAFGFF